MIECFFHYRTLAPLPPASLYVYGRKGSLLDLLNCPKRNQIDKKKKSDFQWGTTLWASYRQRNRPGWETERKRGWEAHRETKSPKDFLQELRIWVFPHCLISTTSINSLIAHFPRWWWHTGVISTEVEKVLILNEGPPGSIPNRAAHYWSDGVRYKVSGSQWNNGNRTLPRVG